MYWELQTLALAASQSSSSNAEKTSRSPPIKTRTEKQEKIYILLQESLSKKISEKVAEKLRSEKEKEKEKNGDREGEEGKEGSLSPTSTLSSSGEVEGVYNLYSPSLDSGDESGEHCVTLM